MCFIAIIKDLAGLCVCWHSLGFSTQKLNIYSLITSHFAWAVSKENVTSLP